MAWALTVWAVLQAVRMGLSQTRFSAVVHRAGLLMCMVERVCIWLPALKTLVFFRKNSKALWLATPLLGGKAKTETGHAL